MLARGGDYTVHNNSAIHAASAASRSRPACHHALAASASAAESAAFASRCVAASVAQSRAAADAAQRVRGIGVRGRGGRAGVQQRCASASAGRGAVRQQQCAEGDVQQRLTVGLHAFMLVLRAMKERGMWLAGRALGGGDVAGVSRMRAAMPRAGETHSSLHAQHAGSSRVRAPQRSRGEAASAPILGTPPSRYGHDLGGMDTARHSTSFRAARAS